MANQCPEYNGVYHVADAMPKLFNFTHDNCIKAAPWCCVCVFGTYNKEVGFESQQPHQITFYQEANDAAQNNSKNYETHLKQVFR